MSEKHEFLLVGAEEIAPPAYAEIVVSEEALEALRLPPYCPAWIARLPLSLPFTHALLTITSSLYFANSLSEAVLIAAFYSFFLLSAATAGIARALHRNERAQSQATRALAVAAVTTIMWPLMALVLVGPALRTPRGCAMMHSLGGTHRHHRARLHHGPALHIKNGRPVPVINVASPDGVNFEERIVPTVVRGGADGLPAAIVFSSKGSRVLIGSGPNAESELDAAIAALTSGVEPTSESLKAAVTDYVVASSGIKVLGTDENIEVQVLIDQL